MGGICTTSASSFMTVILTVLWMFSCNIDSIVNILLCQLIHEIVFSQRCLFFVTACKYLLCLSKEIQHPCSILYYIWELPYPQGELVGMLCLCLTVTAPQLFRVRYTGNDLLL